MYFKQFYLDCLAHASYMVGADGVAAVIDPQRDVDQYIEEARREGLEIRWVLETHLHADFVSGHVELAERTGAEILIGARAGAEFPHVPVSEGHEVQLGDAVRLRALETPGHTPEGICWLVVDSGAPRKLLTGDTLFIGDVGRPDLVGSKGYSAEEMAGMLFDSITGKILPLPDDVEIHPAHGAGSACGRNISRERSSTLGEQKKTNYALAIASREEFIRTMTENLAPAPAYFPVDAELNRRGAIPLNQLGVTELNVEEVRELQAAGGVVLDTRDPASFGAGHVPGSINIGLGGQYASWAGTLLDLERPIAIVAGNRDKALEARVRLARVGVENVVGWLEAGVPGWADQGQPVTTVPQISVADLRALIESGQEIQLVDVRRPAEYASGHVPGAVSRPLDGLAQSVSDLDPSKRTYVICEGGYRSSIGTSLLEARGFGDVTNVTGGTGAWRKASFELERDLVEA